MVDSADRAGGAAARRVLIHSRFSKSLMARIADRFDLLDSGGKPPAEVFSAAERGSIGALITAGGQALPEAVLATLPNLGAVVCYGTGYDGVDLDACRHRGIVVANSPAANAAAVADLAMTLLLAVTRRLVPADAYVRDGGWAAARPSPLLRPPRGLTGRRIGLYGFGDIGRKIAARVAAFEAEVGYFSRTRHDTPFAYFGSLEALAEWCDVLIVAVRAGAATHHAVDANILGRLGKGGILINIARGSVVDEPALIDALRSEAIAGAGLDVFETEPHPPGALTALPNVVVTPHIGGHTLEAHQAMQDCVMANLDAFFAGKPVPFPVVA